MPQLSEAKRAAVRQCLAAGYSIEGTRKQVGVSWDAVYAIKNPDSKRVQQRRARHKAAALPGITLCPECRQRVRLVPGEEICRVCLAWIEKRLRELTDGQ